MQQTAVALSVYFIAKAATALPDVSTALFWFSWYVASLVFPYFPGLLSNLLFELWAIASVRKFQLVAIESTRLKPPAFTDDALHERTKTPFCKLGTGDHS